MEFGRFVGSSSDSSSEPKGKGMKAKAKAKAKAEAEKDLIRRVGEIYCYECSGVDVSLSLGLGPSNPSCQGIPHQGPAQKSGSIARFCRSCGATETPLWRKGPMGTKTLCNACGLRYWKEERTVSSKLTLGLPTPKQVKKW